nr:prenyltransferase/squalene oxidase repeat-containing protein [uncultured Macellibacteroides sp.]
MNKRNEIEEMIGTLRAELLQARTPGGMWKGQLSSSAISTSVAVFALHLIDEERYASHIRKGVEWLKSTMQNNGSWGDSMESPSNLTATLLSYACLYATDGAPSQPKGYLSVRFGGTTDQDIIKGVLAYYGKDLTFSAPILVMCALAGVIKSWKEIPQLPFELSVLPQRLFRFLQLPVVSYAIPALIAVGIMRYRKGKKGFDSPIREAFIGRSLKVLLKLQPAHGGFLEAAPLTAFVAMCMTGAGYREHAATQSAAGFLTDTVREDGSWPIDTNLSSWVTSLSIRALGDDIEDKQVLANCIKRNAFASRHPFTGAREGGWGWTNLPGAAPDADDTSGSLVALHILLDGAYCPEVEKGIEWLLALQNRDGGMPTFCKGWGKLPFDRSCADISAHALLSMQLWMDRLPEALQKRCRNSVQRMLQWMQKNQAEDGSWTPLWFGDQHAKDERSPVYGTAMVVEYLATSEEPLAREMREKGLKYILSVQNADGGWGGAKGVPSKVTLTSRALSALASYLIPETERGAMEQAFEYLRRKYEAGQLFQAEPIGLYFARLWYSERLYNITFALNALKKFQTVID